MGLLNNLYLINFVTDSGRKFEINVEKGKLADWGEVSAELKKKLNEGVQIINIKKLD